MEPVDALQALFGPAGRADPYPYYEELVEQAPALPFRDGAVLSGYHACATVLRDPTLLVDDMVTAQDGTGTQREPSGAVRLLGTSMLSLTPPRPWPDPPPGQPRAAAAEQARDYFAGLVAERRRAPADDLTSALVRVRDGDGDRLGEEELVANLVLILVAGFETTTGLLGNGYERLPVALGPDGR
jgi:cytochrome P450